MHLDTRSWHSHGDGVNSPEALCAAAAELGFDALGICDTNGCYGLIEHYKAALKHNIRPVLGLALTDPEFKPKSGRFGDPPVDPTVAAALVIARDRRGYGQLCELASWRQGVHPDEQVQRLKLPRALASLTDACFVISDSQPLLDYLAPRLGPRRLFVRCAPDYGEAYQQRQRLQARLAARYRLYLAATPDARFIRPQDQPVHHLLRAIGQVTAVRLAGGVRSSRHYLGGPHELEMYYAKHPAALKVARTLAEHCEVDFELGKWGFPDYEDADGRSYSPPQAARLLHDLCLAQGRQRYGDEWGERHERRLEVELDVIYRLHYTSYFLACHDLVVESWRRKMPLLGRGSAANSIVSYLLGITPVDPLEYDLYFERFLNPERQSPPDIDLDFDWRRREEIIGYLYNRWGKARTAMISTHVTYRGRGAWRETAKAFGVPEREIDDLSRRLPWIKASGLRDLSGYPELRGLDLSKDYVQKVLNLASRLEGVPRHLGVHCGGVVIAPRALTDFSGLQKSANGLTVTQYEMHGVEDAGLIKIDILGNRSLGVLTDTVKALNARGVRPPLRDYRSLQHDGETRALIRSGNTMGCFYIESPAMRQLLKRLDTSTYLGLVAASSVIRPGVAESGMMQEYIRRERGLPREQETHPLLEKLLGETHGVMIYQEDVIRVAHMIAGFSRAEADVLRRGMSGKLRSREAINNLRERFVAGCRKNGVELAAALQIWSQVASFGGYAFCKAHSASFAVLSYQVAWLKAHHPAEFMAAVISNGGGFYGASAYISECRRLGLKILPPDVNRSALEYRAESSADNGRFDAVRVGLGQIRSLPLKLKQRIVAGRKEHGRYASLPDFVRRCRPGPAWLELLIICGALESLGLTRPELLRQMQQEFDTASAQGADVLPLTEDHDPQAVRSRAGSAPEYSAAEIYNLDLEHLGVSVRYHPLEIVSAPERNIVAAADIGRYVGKRVELFGRRIAAKRVSVKDKKQAQDWLKLVGEELDNPAEYFELEDSDRLSTAEDLGIIANTAPTVYLNRTGNAMLMLSLEDLTATFEAVLFPDAFRRHAALLRSHPGPYLLRGVVEDMFGACSLTVHQMFPAQQVAAHESELAATGAVAGK